MQTSKVNMQAGSLKIFNIRAVFRLIKIILYV